jgi:hypothetical protein
MTVSGARARLDAYRSTRFLVGDTTNGFCIRIGEVCSELDLLLTRAGADNWAYVTAYNPGGVVHDLAENRARQERLESEVRAAGFSYRHGEGVGEDGTWPPEPSLLVIGIAREDAVALGRRYGQEAIVAGERGTAALLVLC